MGLMTIVKTQKIKSLQQILAKNHPQLGNILQQNQQTQALNDILHTYINDEIVKHCQIVRFAHGEMLLIVENAAWGTKLRYAIPDFIKALKVQPEFKDLKKIRYKLKQTVLQTSSSRKKSFPESTQKHAADLKQMAQKLQQQKSKNK